MNADGSGIDRENVEYVSEVIEDLGLSLAEVMAAWDLWQRRQWRQRQHADGQLALVPFTPDPTTEYGGS